MGFFSGLFGADANSTSGTESKQTPLVQIVRVDSHNNGDSMEVYATVRNDSHARIELDKVRILGMMRELDNFHDPGESKQYLLYSGKRPKDAHQHECELVYKGEDGEYYTAVHHIDYTDEPDGTYSVRNLQFQSPVRGV